MCTVSDLLYSGSWPVDPPPRIEYYMPHPLCSSELIRCCTGNTFLAVLVLHVITL